MTTQKTALKSACLDERRLRFASRKQELEINKREQELRDFERDSLLSWVNEDRDRNMALLYERSERAFNEDQELELELLPYEKQERYIRERERLRENVKRAKSPQIDYLELYERFLSLPIGKDALRVNTNSWKREKRLRSRVRFMFETKRPVFFLTFTFNNESLSQYSEKRLKRAVLKWVHEYADIFIVNKDYGAENARLHFHALVVARNDFVDLSTWSFGYFFARVCGKRASDIANLGAYVAKLSRHAIKESAATDERIVYSRCFALNGV